MGANASRGQNQLDVAASVTLKAKGQISATAAETAISLSELNKAWWSNFEIPHGKFVVNFAISATDRTTGDETYAFALLVDDVIAMNNSPVTIDQFTLVPVSANVGFVGTISRVIDSKDIPNLDIDHNGGDKFLQVSATLGGTTPVMTYACWISKSLGE
jgi:hypothetical protein